MKEAVPQAGPHQPRNGCPGMIASKQPGAESKKAVITAASAGGLIAALLASVCCIGPVVFAALGVGVGATGFLAGTAAALKVLLPYRPAFIGLALVLLGVSFYLAYRRPTIAGVSCQGCVPASGFRLNRLLLWIITLFVVALVLAPYWLERWTAS